MTTRALATSALLAGMAVACGGCESTGPDYDPALPTAWAPAVNNPFFPLVPGTILEYADPSGERTVFEVLRTEKTVHGVKATVVRDRVYVNNVLVEDTDDWFAQDAEGNVWYLGEYSKEMDASGKVVSTEGSWEWGVDGALPGIIMWSNPGAHIGEEYRQEFFEGEAEDWGKVIAVGQTITVTAGTFSNCVQTEDWSGIEGRSKSLEDKFYCAGVGTVAEQPSGKPSARAQLTARRTS